MKRIHLILILCFAVIAAFLLWQRVRIHRKESSLREEIARSEAPSTSLTSNAGGVGKNTDPSKHSRSRTDTFDPDRFISDMNQALRAAGAEPNFEMLRFVMMHREEFAAASLEKLVKTCGMIEKSGIDGGRDIVWEVLLMHIAKSDPSLAIARFDNIISARDGAGTVKAQLDALGKNGQIANHNWNPVYAAALGKWLDSAQAAGRFNETDGEVVATRLDIALVTGNLSVAARQLALLPSGDQSRAADELTKIADTAEARRRLIEQAGTTAGSSAIRELARSFSQYSGFETTRNLLADVELTPEIHDIAAAGIAAARIGPDTPVRAAWLLGALQSDKPSAVTDFTASWALADHQGAGQWLNSLPAGNIRDAAVAGFAPAAARLDGTSAMDWTLTLSNPAQRDSTLKTVYQIWVIKEPEAAEAYLKQKGIEIK